MLLFLCQDSLFTVTSHVVLTDYFCNETVHLSDSIRADDHCLSIHQSADNCQTTLTKEDLLRQLSKTGTKRNPTLVLYSISECNQH